MKTLEKILKEALLDENLIKTWILEHYTGYFKEKDIIINRDNTVDINGTLQVHPRHSDMKTLTDGFTFGRIKGSFFCKNCPNITNLEGGPKIVGDRYIIENCENLKSLTGAPKRIDGDFACNQCNNLKDLDGLKNTKIKFTINVSDNANLISTKGIPAVINDDLDLSYCPKLKEIVDVKSVENTLNIYKTPSLPDKYKSKETCPFEVGYIQNEF